MEATKIEYNGHNYLVIHVSHDPYYGRESVYHVLTNNQKWAGGIINEICGFPNAMSKEKCLKKVDIDIKKYSTAK